MSQNFDLSLSYLAGLLLVKLVKLVMVVGWSLGPFVGWGLVTTKFGFTLLGIEGLLGGCLVLFVGPLVTFTFTLLGGFWFGRGRVRGGWGAGSQFSLSMPWAFASSTLMPAVSSTSDWGMWLGSLLFYPGKVSLA